MTTHEIRKEFAYPGNSLRQSPLTRSPSAYAMCFALVMAFMLNLIGAITAQAQPKWHPGHYVFALNGATDLLGKVQGKPQWKGIKIEHDWRFLEASNSSATNRIWDFSKLRSDYDAAAAAGKYIVVMIRYKVFNTRAVNNYAAPQWVYDDGGVVEFYNGNNAPIDSARIWIPWVRLAFKDLLVALAAEFENKPYFEGIQFEETAVSGVDKIDSSFTAAAYKDALLQNMKDAKAVFITSNVWQQANYNGGDATLMPAIYQNAFDVGGGISGPDTLMTGSTQSNDELVAGNWFGKIPLSLDQQRPQVLFDGYTPSQVFLKVTEVYKLNHVMWNGKEDVVPTAGTWGATWGFAEVDAMLNNPPNGYAPFYVNSAVPQNLQSAPAAPASLTATAVAATQVNTSWPDVTGETQYRLERKTGTGAFGPLATKAVNSTAHIDTTVVGNTSYTYRIRSENAAGNSAWRVSNSVTTPSGNVLYEAESGTLGGGASVRTYYSGYSGTGYVEMDAGATIQWTVSPGAGSRTMTFRFGCSGTKKVEIRINGNVVVPSHSIVGSGRGNWLNSNVTASFTSGANTIKITRLTGSGALDIDYVRVQ